MKRWDEMRDLWHLFRGSLPRLEGLSYAYEKAGLTLENQPIPWCADGVLVGASVDMPQQAPRAKGDFELRVGSARCLAESFRVEGPLQTTRLQFRVAAPPQSTAIELLWRGRSLGQLFLPILSENEYVRKLSLDMPTAGVRIGNRVVACRTYVATQCQELLVSGILQSPTNLAPITDLGLRVEVRREEGGATASAFAELSSSQRKSRQALVTVVPPKPKRLGTWQINWHLGELPLAAHTLRAISLKHFLRSLRVCQARFVLQDKRGQISIDRHLTTRKDVARVGPCFFITSSEPGMAGWCKLQVRAHVKGAIRPPLLEEQDVLITDGPHPFAPGTIAVDELDGVTHFELRTGRIVLGTLPLSPVPSALFTQEGGFVAPDTFDWSPTAEEQLREKLGKLLEP